MSGPALYVDGATYRTVATPNDLSGTAAPAQLNVAEAAPGDTDYNGGRWMVHAVSFPSGYDAALAAGDLAPAGHAASSGRLTARYGDSARRKSGASKAAPAEATPVVRVRPVRMRSTASTASGALMA